MLERAIEIALTSHKEQRDKAGELYVLHPLRLMMEMDTETERIVAVLHDVVEDSNGTWTFDKLAQEGFSDEITSCLRLLTHDKKEDYFEYVRRIKQNPLATKVKLADLKDNLDSTRLPDIDNKTMKRLVKYHKAYLFLSKE
ncbi:MAG: GTP pyrophosphokinase [Actinobacteria bacterium]|nr:GTP pyrophosphokinase [Actinomycetota bacterium]